MTLRRLALSALIGLALWALVSMAVWAGVAVVAQTLGRVV